MKAESPRYEARVLPVDSDVRLLQNKTRSRNSVLSTLTSPARKAIDGLHL